jgi:two-component system response regulator HydG
VRCLSKPQPLKVIEKRAIQEALAGANGSRKAAAKVLGIGRTTLYRKVREYKL